MEIITSIENQKQFFRYIIKNKLFDSHPGYIFSQKDIRDIYDYTVEYYKEYNDIPSCDYIYEKFDNPIKKSAIENLFDVERLNEVNKDYLIDTLNDHVKKSIAVRNISQLIDDQRNGNWDLVFSRLSEKFTPIIEDFNYDNKTQEEVSKFHKMLSSSEINIVDKYLDQKLDLSKQYKISKYLLYPIFKEGQLCAFYGGTGDGKTVLAVEFANIISKGICDWDGWYCECPPQNVCYIDFELGSSSFAGRYKQGKFSPNLHIINVNVNEYNNFIGWANNQSVRIDRAIQYIEQKAKDTNSKIIFIDNLSNIADQVEQAKEADRFISDLYGRMKTLGLTIVFLGHTPKIPKDAKISLNHFKGSSSLTKTFESIIGFKRSVYKNISYIKQVKHRDLELIYDDESIGKFEFKEDKYGYKMDFIGTDEEDNMLNKNYKDNDNARKYDNEIICDVLYDKYENKMSINNLSDKYSIPRKMITDFNKYYEDNKYDLINYYEEYKKRIKNDLF